MRDIVRVLAVTGLCNLLMSAPLQAQDNGYQLEVAYTSDAMANIHGGVKTGIRYMDNLDVTLNLDLERLIGWNHSTLFLYGLANQGKSISELAGDIQGISNIDAENSWRLYEAWWQQQFADMKASLLVGLFDTNAEFDYIHTGQLFINSSHGIGPDFGLSGRLGPSTFPYTSPGVRLKFSDYNGFVFKTAVLDGVPSDPANTRGTKIRFGRDDGLLALAEFSFSPFEKPAGRDAIARHLGHRAMQMNTFRVALGGWLYTADRMHWNQAETGKSWGLYMIGENRLSREAANPGQGLSAFLRLGITNGEVHRLGGYFGTGMVYSGPFEGRGNDQAGIAFSHAPNSPEYRDVQRLQGNPAEHAENTIEWTYQWHVSEHVQLQGDVQYIINPNTDPDLENAFVAGVRLLVTL